MSALVLREERDGELVRLKSPAVGTFTCALPGGRTLVAGQVAGVLTVLGGSHELARPRWSVGRRAQLSAAARARAGRVR
jgi:hypothetical protein